MESRRVLRAIKSYYFLITLGLLSVLIAPFLFIDNIDRTPWEEPLQQGLRVRVSPMRKLMQEAELESMTKENERIKLNSIVDVLITTKNLCIGGQDPQMLTLEEHQDAFNAGPCNPIVLVPGLAGTSLQIKIDCERLLKARPDIFKGCGWQTCSGYQLWNRRPDTEYRLWISSITSPVGMVTASRKTSCFGDVIQLLYDPEEPIIKKRYTDVEGIELTYYGDTPRTAPNSDCGLQAIGELTDDRIIKLTTCDQRGFTSLAILYKGMGYLSGLTMQAVPYDYRRSIVTSDASQLISSTIENLRRITGKKAVILTHSLGSLHALQMLSLKTQEWKDQHVAALLTAGGPYLGSTKAVRSTLGGDPSYMDKWLGLNVGINYYCQNRAINTGSSSLDLYPKDTYFKFQNEPWMIELQQRIKYEEDYLANQTSSNTPLPLDWYPSPYKTCSLGMATRRSECLTHLTDLTKPFLTIGNDSFTSKREDILNIHEKFSVNGTRLSQTFVESDGASLYEFKQPGVPTLVLFGAFSKVEESFSYNLNPKVVVESTNDFYFPNVTSSTYGDGTVSTSSAITPAIKWIHEHKHNKTNKPTKIIEICSTYDQGNQGALYDKIVNGTKTLGESGYLGIPCECLKKKDYSSCRHSCMINDKYFIKLAAEFVQTDERSMYLDFKSPLNEQELYDFRGTCKNLQKFETF